MTKANHLDYLVTWTTWTTLIPGPPGPMDHLDHPMGNSPIPRDTLLEAVVVGVSDPR